MRREWKNEVAHKVHARFSDQKTKKGKRDQQNAEK